MDKRLSKALDSYQRREFDQAALACRDALREEPSNPVILHLLGVIVFAQGDPEEADHLLSQALIIKPDHADGLHDHAKVLVALNRPEAALRRVDQALAQRPTFAKALLTRGTLLHMLKQTEAALESVEEALVMMPDSAVAFTSHGTILLSLGRSSEALTSLDKALSKERNNPAILNLRGEALRSLHRYDEALESFDRAIALKPNYLLALFNRAGVLLTIERTGDALAAFDRVLAIKPGFAPAHHNRGLALQKMDMRVEAVASYDRALAIDPYLIDALNNRGVALMSLDPKQALATFDKLLALAPDHLSGLYNRGIMLGELGRHDEAVGIFTRVRQIDATYKGVAGKLLSAKLQCCDWSDWLAEARRVITQACGGRDMVGAFESLVLTDSPAEQFFCARSYAQLHFPPAEDLPKAGARHDNDRIRIAYVSADFYNHPTAHLTAELFEIHDRTRFEIYGISFGPYDNSDMRARLTSAFDQFFDVRSQGDDQTATLFRGLEIDIAVDLKGYTQLHRAGIFKRRAAPIQVNYLAYPGTMGADFIDYIIADHHLVRPEDRQFYSEKIIYLPDSYQVNDRKRRIAATALSRTEVGLPESAFVFCCFNANYKITPDIFEIWMRLLHRVDGAVLWLFENNLSAAHNLRAEAARHGIAPERLVFAPRMKLERHLERYRLADLFLDTFHVTAHTTASDALWAGLPVLTCSGSSFVSRVAGSLLHAVGLSELVTHNLQSYEALALKIAIDPSMLRDLKAKLARNRDTQPLFDTDRFRRHIESAYVAIWERWKRGEPAANVFVS